MSRFVPMSRRKALLLALPLVVILMVVLPVYWLLHTAAGAAWLWNRVERLDAIEVSASQVTGDLAGGFGIRDLGYRSDAFDLSVGYVEIQAGAAWWPPSIEVRKLSMQDIDVLIHAAKPAAGQADENTDVGGVLGALEPPVPLRISDAVLTNINVGQGDDPSVMAVKSVSFGLSLDKQLVVNHLDILANGLQTGIKAQIALTPPFQLSIDAQGRLEHRLEPGATLLALPFRLEGAGDLEKLKLSLTSARNGLQLDGEVREPFKRLQWNLDATVDHVELPEDMGGQGITLSAITLNGHGGVREWTFDLDSAVHEDHAGDARVTISGSGTPAGIEISGARLTGTGLDLDVSGKLDWSAQTQASVQTVIRKLDLSPWLADWPAGDVLSGEFELDWSGKGVRIPKGHLGVDGSPATVDFEANIDIAADSVSARLNWSDLAWPPTGAATDFSSRSGRLDVSGSITDWRAGGQLDIQLGDYPRGRFDIQGGGDRTSARFVIPGGEILGGVVRGEAGADWSVGLDWDAAITAKGIDPGQVLGEWPGTLDGDIRIESRGQPQRTRIAIAALHGMLRGVPVQARGGIDITESGPAFESLDVQTDKAVLKLDGAMAEPAGVEFSFDGEIPTMLLHGARGKARVEGRYSSMAAQPMLELQAQGTDLAWNDLSIGTLAASTSATADAQPPAVLQLDASELAWKDVNLDDVSLAVNPVDDQYEVNLMMTREDIVLNSVLMMKPENGELSLGGNWRGLLSGFDVDIGPAYSFNLLKPAAIAWSSGAVTMEPVCLSESAGPSLCLDIDYRDNGDWSLDADANAIPLDYLRDIFDLDVHFEQLVEGHMEWHQLSGQAPTGGAELKISAGRILDLLDNEVLASTKEGKFGFQLKNGNLESGVLELEFPGTGFIDVDFNILDIAVGGEQILQGRAVTRLDKLTLLGQLALPGVDAVDGQFESDIQIGGNLKNPEFDGDFGLSNGLVEYAPLGFRLEDIEIQGRVHKRDQGDFSGSLRAGEGVASFEGRFLFDDAGSTRMNVDLTGGPLLLVNTDALKIFSEQELQVAFAPGRVDLNGHITIPRASLTPANLQFEEVRDSEDLVIESPEAEPQDVAAESPGKNQIFGQLEVALGEDVRIKVPGIDVKVTGSTMFDWNGDSVPMANGAYKIHGKVDVYGPVLRIDNGTVSFPGVPANNPLLNIRAGRDIYGNTQIRSAGVQVTGNLKHPVLEAYTVPITNEDRAWTLLVTGTDFDQAQGVSGFDLGTYIAPRLYISYGISLFENENVVSARYDLKKGFGVKVTSGQRETGVDVSYTINR